MTINDIIRKYHRLKPNQRLGQFIYNELHTLNREIPECPNLYYEKDDIKAINLAHVFYSNHFNQN